MAGQAKGLEGLQPSDNIFFFRLPKRRNTDNTKEIDDESGGGGVHCLFALQKLTRCWHSTAASSTPDRKHVPPVHSRYYCYYCRGCLILHDQASLTLVRQLTCTKSKPNKTATSGLAPQPWNVTVASLVSKRYVSTDSGSAATGPTTPGEQFTDTP